MTNEPQRLMDANRISVDYMRLHAFRKDQTFLPIICSFIVLAVLETLLRIKQTSEFNNA